MPGKESTMPRIRINPVPKYPTLEFENRIWESRVIYAAGLDEAGRGAWAGPVSAAAVILPPGEAILETLSGVRDSKQMTPQARSDWAPRIRAHAVATGVGMASHLEIDRLGIVPATRLAMQRALQNLGIAPDHLLIDSLTLPEIKTAQTVIIKGDACSLSIACASVLAKTARDALMREMDHHFPGYGFERHKGYGTAFHRQALQEMGPCDLHRKTYAPIRSLLPYTDSE